MLINPIRYLRRKFYQDALRETLFRQIKGEPGLELARRFFNYKIFLLRKKGIYIQLGTSHKSQQ